MGEEEEDHTMEEVEEEQEVEDFSNSKDTALAGFLNINGYVKSILKVDDMMRKSATLTPGLPVSWGIDKGYPGLFFCLFCPISRYQRMSTRCTYVLSTQYIFGLGKE